MPYRLQRYASLPSEDLVLLHRTHPHSVRINDYFVIIDLDVIPLHYSAIADANGFEPFLIVLETIVLPVTPSIHTRAIGFEPILRKSKSRVLTICTTPYY